MEFKRTFNFIEFNLCKLLINFNNIQNDDEMKKQLITSNVYAAEEWFEQVSIEAQPQLTAR